MKLLVGANCVPIFIHRGLLSRVPVLREKLAEAATDSAAIAVPDVEPPVMVAVCAFLYKGVVEWPIGMLPEAPGTGEADAGTPVGPGGTGSCAALQQRIRLYSHARKLGLDELAAAVAASLSSSTLLSERDLLGIGQWLHDKSPAGDDVWLERFFAVCVERSVARNPSLATSDAVLAVIGRGGPFAVKLHRLLALSMLKRMKVAD